MNTYVTNRATFRVQVSADAESEAVIDQMKSDIDDMLSLQLSVIADVIKRRYPSCETQVKVLR